MNKNKFINSIKVNGSRGESYNLYGDLSMIRVTYTSKTSEVQEGELKKAIFGDFSNPDGTVNYDLYNRILNGDYGEKSGIGRTFSLLDFIRNYYKKSFATQQATISHSLQLGSGSQDLKLLTGGGKDWSDCNFSLKSLQVEGTPSTPCLSFKKDNIQLSVGEAPGLVFWNCIQGHNGTAVGASTSISPAINQGGQLGSRQLAWGASFINSMNARSLFVGGTEVNNADTLEAGTIQASNLRADTLGASTSGKTDSIQLRWTSAGDSYGTPGLLSGCSLMPKQHKAGSLGYNQAAWGSAFIHDINSTSLYLGADYADEGVPYPPNKAHALPAGALRANEISPSTEANLIISSKLQDNAVIKIAAGSTLTDAMQIWHFKGDDKRELKASTSISPAHYRSGQLGSKTYPWGNVFAVNANLKSLSVGYFDHISSDNPAGNLDGGSIECEKLIARSTEVTELGGGSVIIAGKIQIWWHENTKQLKVKLIEKEQHIVIADFS